VLRYLIFGYPRFLLRDSSAQVETSFATLAYNLKTLSRVLGSSQLIEMLQVNSLGFTVTARQKNPQNDNGALSIRAPLFTLAKGRFVTASEARLFGGP